MADVSPQDIMESVEETQRLLARLPDSAFEEQADFFDDGLLGIELATLDKPQKRYTAVELEKRVVVRDMVCRLLAEGVGIMRIAKSLRAQGIEIGERSIMALRDRRPDLVAIEKKQLSTGLARVLKLSLETYEDALINKKIPATQIPIAFGIFSDKKAALDGDASLVIEHRHTIAQSADGFLAKLQAIKQAKVTNVTDVTPTDSPSTDLPP
jgi:hypothetical protein